jgi:MFS family permease
MQAFEKSDRSLSVLLLLILLITSFYSLLSGPVAELVGIKDLLPGVREISRESRIVLVYHSLSVPFIAFITIFIISTLSIKEGQRRSIVHALVFGSLLSSLGAVLFGYLGAGMIAHGIFIFGLSVVFYAGINFLLAVLKHPINSDSHPYFSLEEKIALSVLSAAILVSAVLGACVGAFYGTQFSTVLAEDIVRKEHSIFDRAVISHLHIMLALIAAAVLFAAIRFYKPGKDMGKIFYWLFTAGTSITSVATWSVLIFEKTAHKIINVGAAILILTSFIFVLKAVREAIREKLFIHYRLLASFLLIYVNLIVTAPGVYVAVNLEHFRKPGMEAIERTFAVGHWHLLAVVCALVIANLFFDFVRIRNKYFVLSSYAANILIAVSLSSAVFYMFTRKEIFLTSVEIFLAPGFILLLFLLASSFFKGFFKPSRGYLYEVSDQI